MKQFGIYSILNKINGKRYIGQTVCQFDRRWKDHIRDLNKNNHCNDKLQGAWNKYGEDSFEFSIVHLCDELDDLNRLEVYYIYKYDSFNNGYNLTIGGDGVTGCNEEERLKNLYLITQRQLNKRGISIKQVENAKILLSEMDKDYSTSKVIDIVSNKIGISKDLVFRIWHLNSYKHIKSELNDKILENSKHLSYTDTIIELFKNTSMTLDDIGKQLSLTRGQLVYRLKKNKIPYSDIDKKRKQEKIRKQVIDLYNTGERKLSAFKSKLHLTDTTIHKILDENGTSIRTKKVKTRFNKERNSDVKGINWDIGSKRWLIKHSFNKTQYIIATERNYEKAVLIKNECNESSTLDELMSIKEKYKKDTIPMRKIKIIKDGVVVEEILGIGNASRKLNIPRKSIEKCLSGNQKTSYGYEFKYC